MTYVLTAQDVLNMRAALGEASVDDVPFAQLDNALGGVNDRLDKLLQLYLPEDAEKLRAEQQQIKITTISGVWFMKREYLRQLSVLLVKVLDGVVAREKPVAAPPPVVKTKPVKALGITPEIEESLRKMFSERDAVLGEKENAAQWRAELEKFGVKSAMDLKADGVEKFIESVRLKDNTDTLRALTKKLVDKFGVADGPVKLAKIKEDLKIQNIATANAETIALICGKIREVINA